MQTDRRKLRHGAQREQPKQHRKRLMHMPKTASRTARKRSLASRRARARAANLQLTRCVKLLFEW